MDGRRVNNRRLQNGKFLGPARPAIKLLLFIILFYFLFFYITPSIFAKMQNNN